MRSVAHKIRLSPNNKQKTYFKKGCGIARFSWNWALGAWKEAYQNGERPNGMKLKKAFNAIKKETYPWVYEITKYANQQPFLQLQDAWNRFFKGLGGKPTFKKKGKSVDSFYIGGDQIQVVENKIKIPNLGWVKMKECLRFEGKINSVTVSRTANNWFVSIQMSVADAPIDVRENQTGIGLDVGLKHFATFSNGVTIEAPKPLANKLHKLKRLSRQLSKKKKGSRNFQKAKERIARLHAQIANIRRDYLQKLSSVLTKNFSYIALESLNVKGMIKNKRLARSIADVGWGYFFKFLDYKAKWYGSKLLAADRWYASSKTCNVCQHKKEHLSLSERIFVCEHCGSVIDRDHNAALNLEKELIPIVCRKLMPAEMTALLEFHFGTLATSIVETGMERQVLPHR